MKETKGKKPTILGRVVIKTNLLEGRQYKSSLLNVPTTHLIARKAVLV